MVDLMSRNGLQKLAVGEDKDVDYSQGHVVVKVLLMPSHGKWPHMRPAPEGSLLEPAALDEPASVSDATARRGAIKDGHLV